MLTNNLYKQRLQAMLTNNPYKRPLQSTHTNVAYKGFVVAGGRLIAVLLGRAGDLGWARVVADDELLGGGVLEQQAHAVLVQPKLSLHVATDAIRIRNLSQSKTYNDESCLGM